MSTKTIDIYSMRRKTIDIDSMSSKTIDIYLQWSSAITLTRVRASIELDIDNLVNSLITFETADWKKGSYTDFNEITFHQKPIFPSFRLVPIHRNPDKLI